MSDYAEMAAAFEQARTAPDPSDKASAHQLLSEMHGVAVVRERLHGRCAAWIVRSCGRSAAMADSRMTARERAYVRRLDSENAQLRAQLDKQIDIYRDQAIELIELRAKLDLLREVANG